jgi:hypothetical protein
LTQTTLRADGNLELQNPMNDDRKGEILKSLVEFIVDDKQAVSFVKTDSFGSLCFRFAVFANYRAVELLCVQLMLYTRIAFYNLGEFLILYADASR